MTPPLTPAPPAAPVPVPRSRLWSYLLAIALVGLGAVLGSAVTVMVLSHRALHGLAHPDQAPALIAAHLERRLRLSPAQAAAVRATLDERQAAIQAIRRRAEPELAAELDRTRREVAAHLDPAQAESWYRLFDRLRRRLHPQAPGSSTRPSRSATGASP